jgi:hypothetical protein
MAMAPTFEMIGSLGRKPRLIGVAGIVVLSLLPHGAVQAQSPPTVDAGPAKTLNFPATDVTLFGHATDPNNNPLTIQWTQVSGPAPATFSAPWALATTVSFTTTGSYIFRLSGSNGTSTATQDVAVTVNPASAQTAFYVDPTYSGNTKDGSAAHPWTGLFDADSDYVAKWNAINSALATNDVIVYFSARQAGSDVPEAVSGKSVFVRRPCRTRIASPLVDLSQCPAIDTTTKHLTLDGMSLYNANDAVPNWVTYTGTTKFKLSNCSSSLCIGSGDHLRRDHITIRGFETTGNSGRLIVSGSDNVLEYINTHDTSGDGPGPLYDNSITDYPDCVPLESATGVTFRHIISTKVIGEGIYIGGTYDNIASGGCPPPTYDPPVSYDLLVENNTIDNPGQNGEEGDCIDLKAGWIHMTVRGNVCTNGHHANEGTINWDGAFNNAVEDYLFEQNDIHSFPSYGGFTGVMTNGVTIRNNLVYGSSTSYGIYLLQSAPWPMTNVRVYNNTVYGNGTAAIVVGGASNIDIKNNLVFGSGTGHQIVNGGGSNTNLTSDFNLLAPSGSDFSEGSHSIIRSSTSGIVVNAGASDFHVISGSPAIAAGIDLSIPANLTALTTSFASDYSGATRPQGLTWDIGAYRFGTDGRPSAPQNLRIVR